MLKSIIRSSLGAFGVRVERIHHQPFEELFDVPRFTEHTVKVLGRDFSVADASSFEVSYREIFRDEIYRFDAATDTPRVIDCGSNYGTSIVYAKHIFPKARITGIEADPKIYALLRRNCSHLDVELLHRAVSTNSEPVTFYSEGSDGGRAAHVIDAPRDVVEVQGITLDNLIDGPVDFLKIDIEGSESAAIGACTKLALVRNLFVEYHSFRDTRQSLGDLLTKLRDSGFRFYVRELFCSKTPFTRDEVHLGMDLQLNIFAKRHP